MNHFERLMQMYYRAPIHEFYQGIEINVEDSKTDIKLPIDNRYHHAGDFAHGSIYFKLMDDACYFACQSMVTDAFLVTTNFNVHLLRPIFDGSIIAKGKVDFQSQNLYTASAQLFNEQGKLVGSGQGQFMKSKVKLDEVDDYAGDHPNPKPRI